jgi:glycosyltransferase involved in cell wall biosynthesis
MTLVSIVVPMRNAEPYIFECLNSLIANPRPDLEIIVVDDKSEDRSRDIADAILDNRICIVDGPGTGISDCLNTGLSRAKGSIVMRCDADDTYPAGRIDEQIAWLQDHPEYDAVCGSFCTVHGDGSLIMEMPCGEQSIEITENLRIGNVKSHLCTFAIRSKLISRVGTFRRYLVTVEDIDFQLRLSEFGRIAYIPKNWYNYRIHANSITSTQHASERMSFEAMAKSLNQQRRTGRKDDLSLGLLPELPKTSRHRSMANTKIQNLLLGRAWIEHSNGQFIKSIRTGIRSIAEYPLSISVWRSVAALIIKSVLRNQ